MLSLRRFWTVALLIVGGSLVPRASGQDAREGRPPDRAGSPVYPATPEESEQFYDRVLERQLARATRLYELTPEQQAQVRARLEQLKEEHRQYAAPRRQEMEQLREQIREAIAEGRASGRPDNAKLVELGSRIREILRGSPFLSTNTATAEIEKVLPAEQAERGRTRREQSEALAERGTRSRRLWRPGARPEDGQVPGRWEEGGVARDPDAGLGSWERYVRDFARRYGLDAAQQAAAQSVLRSSLEQRQVYEVSRRADYSSANLIEDAQSRQERIKELNAPVLRMFEDLKRQLERIPTSAQREAAEGPATQPAETSAATHPSGS